VLPIHASPQRPRSRRGAGVATESCPTNRMASHSSRCALHGRRDESTTGERARCACEHTARRERDATIRARRGVWPGILERRVDTRFCRGRSGHRSR
jgi:hypothetical protein